MFERIRLGILSAFVLTVAGLAAHAQDLRVERAAWSGTDFVMRFSDTLSYSVDPVASDSMLVLRFSKPLEVGEEELSGPDGIHAVLSRGLDDDVTVLTVRGDGRRIGYSTLWRPYSNRLIIHTFDWDSLQYAEEQYHKGLLAIEQNLPDQAKEYLSGANAFGERRAASVLGVLYEREGHDSLASIYLRAPLDPDDYKARANINRRAGNMQAAKQDGDHFDRKLTAMSDSAGSSGFAPSDSGAEESPETADAPPIATLFEDWTGIALVVVALLFIILLAAWFSRRPSQKEQPVEQPAPPAAPSQGTTTPAETAPKPVEPTQPIPLPAERIPGTETPATGTRRETGITASMHSPEIPVADPHRKTESESDTETESKVGADELPHPDALPDSATPREVAAKTGQEVPPPAASTDQRRSLQAEQLRQRMAAAQSPEQTHPTKTAQQHSAPTEGESTVSEARRLNVSRDYVELRNRITELRKRIDEQ